MATLSTGMGSGTPQQELERWLREAGKLTVHDEGEQNRLFDNAPVRMYRIYNRKGESITLTADTARSYGLQPTEKQRCRPAHADDLFTAAQGFMFGSEV